MNGAAGQISAIQYCKQAVEKQMKKQLKDGIRPSFSILFIDINRLKTINEIFGYSTGDKVLKAAFEHFQKKFGTDAVFQWGGGDFIVLLPDINPKDALAAANKLIETFKEPLIIDSQLFYLSINAGIASYPEHGMDDETLLNNAEIAMYKAKSKGRNQFKLFESSMTAKEDRLLLEIALHQAIDNQELFLVYQPRMDMETSKMVGVEALVRWRHPQFGIIPPDKFIPIAEDTGLIHEIDFWVMEQAVKQLKVWHRLGFTDLFVSVNLSTENFRSPHLMGKVKDILKSSQINPSKLELEITESILMKNEEAVINTLYQLNEIGINISIDDFGTGYSSLSYLKNFPVNALKIDKSFISTLYTGAATEVVSAIIQLGHSLNLRVVAEGIETEDQCSLLKSIQCDEAQGYYFYRPISGEEILDIALQKKDLSKPAPIRGEILSEYTTKIEKKDDIFHAWKKIKDFVINSNFDERTVMKLQLAIEEACTNAYEYCSKHSEIDIEVTFVNKSHALEMYITHPGTAYWMQSYNGIYKGLRGRGLSLILQLVDKVDVFSKDNKIIFYMRKNHTF